MPQDRFSLLNVYLYPNPSDGGVVVLQKDAILKNVRWRVLNALGKEVISWQNLTFKKEHALSLGHQAKGVYFFQFLSEDGMAVKKLILE